VNRNQSPRPGLSTDPSNRCSFDRCAAADGRVRIEVSLGAGGASATLIDNEAMALAHELLAMHAVATEYAGQYRPAPKCGWCNKASAPREGLRCYDCSAEAATEVSRG
jgi:hypothetical protein